MTSRMSSSTFGGSHARLYALPGPAPVQPRDDPAAQRQRRRTYAPSEFTFDADWSPLADDFAEENAPFWSRFDLRIPAIDGDGDGDADADADTDCVSHLDFDDEDRDEVEDSRDRGGDEDLRTLGREGCGNGRSADGGLDVKQGHGGYARGYGYEHGYQHGYGVAPAHHGANTRKVSPPHAGVWHSGGVQALLAALDERLREDPRGEWEDVCWDEAAPESDEDTDGDDNTEYGSGYKYGGPTHNHDLRNGVGPTADIAARSFIDYDEPDAGQQTHEPEYESDDMRADLAGTWTSYEDPGAGAGVDDDEQGTVYEESEDAHALALVSAHWAQARRPALGLRFPLLNAPVPAPSSGSGSGSGIGSPVSPRPRGIPPSHPRSTNSRSQVQTPVDPILSSTRPHTPSAVPPPVPTPTLTSAPTRTYSPATVAPLPTPPLQFSLQHAPPYPYPYPYPYSESDSYTDSCLYSPTNGDATSSAYTHVDAYAHMEAYPHVHATSSGGGVSMYRTLSDPPPYTADAGDDARCGRDHMQEQARMQMQTQGENVNVDAETETGEIGGTPFVATAAAMVWSGEVESELLPSVSMAMAPAPAPALASSLISTTATTHGASVAPSVGVATPSGLSDGAASSHSRSPRPSPVPSPVPAPAPGSGTWSPVPRLSPTPRAATPSSGQSPSRCPSPGPNRSLSPAPSSLRLGADSRAHTPLSSRLASSPAPPSPSTVPALRSNTHSPVHIHVSSRGTSPHPHARPRSPLSAATATTPLSPTPFSPLSYPGSLSSPTYTAYTSGSDSADGEKDDKERERESDIEKEKEKIRTRDAEARTLLTLSALFPVTRPHEAINFAPEDPRRARRERERDGAHSPLSFTRSRSRSRPLPCLPHGAPYYGAPRGLGMVTGTWASADAKVASFADLADLRGLHDAKERERERERERVRGCEKEKERGTEVGEEEDAEDGDDGYEFLNANLVAEAATTAAARRGRSRGRSRTGSNSNSNSTLHRFANRCGTLSRRIATSVNVVARDR